MNTERRLLGLAAALLALLWLIGCVGNARQQESRPLPKMLDVGTLYSPTSFFILKGDTM